MSHVFPFEGGDYGRWPKRSEDLATAWPWWRRSTHAVMVSATEEGCATRGFVVRWHSISDENSYVVVYDLHVRLLITMCYRPQQTISRSGVGHPRFRKPKSKQIDNMFANFRRRKNAARDSFVGLQQIAERNPENIYQYVNKDGPSLETILTEVSLRYVPHDPNKWFSPFVQHDQWILVGFCNSICPGTRMWLRFIISP